MPDNSAQTLAISQSTVTPEPVSQPMGPLGYAIIGFLNLAVAVGIAVGIFYAGTQLAAQPTLRLLNFFLLAVLGITSALFLFGVMRSGAALSGKKLDVTVELGGPVVVAVLLVAGGYYFTKVPDTFPLTFRLPPETTLLQDMVSDVKLVVDLPGRREQVTFNANGEGTIQEVSQKYVGTLVPITISSNEYRFENNQTTINVAVPDSQSIILNLFQVSQEEKRKRLLRAIYDELIDDINLELTRKDAMLFPAIERYLDAPTQEGWIQVKAAAADSEQRIKNSLDKELKIRSDSELITLRRNAATSLSQAPTIRTVIETHLLNQAFQTHGQRVNALERIPKVVLPSRDEVVRWRDEMKILYLEMRDQVRDLIERPEI